MYETLTITQAVKPSYAGDWLNRMHAKRDSRFALLVTWTRRRDVIMGIRSRSSRGLITDFVGSGLMCNMVLGINYMAYPI